MFLCSCEVFRTILTPFVCCYYKSALRFLFLDNNDREKSKAFVILFGLPVERKEMRKQKQTKKVKEEFLKKKKGGGGGGISRIKYMF